MITATGLTGFQRQANWLAAIAGQGARTAGITTGAAFIVLLATMMIPAAAQDRGCSRPQIVARGAWYARPAIENRMSAQVPESIIIHHTGVAGHPQLKLERKLKDLQRYAQRPGSKEGRPKRALGDMPYHFFIGYSGRIGEGRSLQFAGDTRTDYNPENKIQIVLEGDFTTEDPQESQLSSLRDLVCWLRAEFGIAKSAIVTHRDVAATSCPGKKLLDVLPQLNFGD